MNRRDGFFSLLLLFCLGWFVVLWLSGCQWVDGPMAFVRGCYHYGVNWNSVMAPTGMVVILALPISLVYWFWRLLEWLFNKIFNKIK